MKRVIQAKAGEKPNHPKTGTAEHLLLSILSFGYRVEIIKASADGPATFYGAMRRLRRKGYDIREYSTRSPYGHCHATVFALGSSADADLRDDDGGLILVSIFDTVNKVCR